MNNPKIALIAMVIATGSLAVCPKTGALEPTPAGAKVARAAMAALAAGAEQEVKGDILPFWLKYTRNPENGGFYGFIDKDMVVHKSSQRGGLLTCRILWTFSAAYRIYHDPAYLEMARYAYRDLVDHFWDPDNGGLFWSIAVDGTPKSDFKLIYLQTFGIYGLSEYYRATGEKPALEKAIAIYNLIEEHSRDRKNGGYFDALDRKWARISDGENRMGPGPKSQNSHIHILEGYTNLLRAWPDAGLRASQHDLAEMVIRHLIDPKTHHLILFTADDWTPIGLGEVSYGHDIELSWLLVEAAKVLGDPALIAGAKTVSLDIARVTLAEGVDPDGGVVNDGGPGGYTDTNKDWWPQAEAAIGFLNAYQLSGDPRYFEASRRSWDYIEAKFVDRVHGDWIEEVTRDGTPVPRPKVTVWKCPYHSSRCCFELVDRVHELMGAGPAP